MKLLYVGDNSDRINWGCRATSIALRELLAREHDVVGVISGKMIEARYPVSDRLGDRFYGPVAQKLYRKKLRNVPVLGAALFGMIERWGDPVGIGLDLDANIANLRRARAYSPLARALFEAVEHCDAVAVNGEGDLIFTTPPRQKLLYILTVCRLAQTLGKSVYYLNAMLSECPINGIHQPTLEVAARVLADCAAVVVREFASQAFVQAHMPAVRATMLPDALFSWRYHFAQSDAPAKPGIERVLPYFEHTGRVAPKVAGGPFVAISGSSLASRDPARARATYTAMVRKLKAVGVPLLLVPTCGGDLFLKDVAADTGVELLPVDTPILAGAAVLANARVFVSGRWHPSIMAALGGTPCVFLGSNSHKTLSIQTLLEYDTPREFDAFPSDADAQEIVRATIALLGEGDARRATILQVSKRLAEDAARCLDLIV
ncbi:polysaccharide pyruvyl transferase family protein [soil metagenome]